MTLIGAPELERRLKATENIGRDSGRVWAAKATSLARSYAPRRTGAGSASMRPVVNQKGAKVVGLYYMGAMMAKGTKAHEIPKSRFTKTGRLRRGKAAGTGKTLRFNVGGQTFFRRKVHQRGDRPNNFAARAANEALGHSLKDTLIALWNGAA